MTPHPTEANVSADEMIQRLRGVPRGRGHSFESRPGVWMIVPYGNIMNDAADLIAALSPRQDTDEMTAVEMREAWQPVETAPSEGEFLAGYWWRERWLSNVCKMRRRPSGDKVIEARFGWLFPATHWMPLSPGPTTKNPEPDHG